MRDKSTDVHAKNQQKISHKYNLRKLRLTIARKLGYDTISCIIAEDVHWAHAYQLILQDGVINNEIISE